MPENYELSPGRLIKALMKRLEKDRDLLQRYDKTIKDQLSKEAIEKFEEKIATENTIYRTTL